MPMTTQIADLIGLSEIAELFGVDKNVANGWRQRHDFPRPVHKLRMGPLWDKQEVLQWRRPGPVVNGLACMKCGSKQWQGASSEEIGKEEWQLSFLCGGCGHYTLIAITREGDRQYFFTTWTPEEGA
jgi:hypothetical protein